MMRSIEKASVLEVAGDAPARGQAGGTMVSREAELAMARQAGPGWARAQPLSSKSLSPTAKEMRSEPCSVSLLSHFDGKHLPLRVRSLSFTFS